MKNTYNVTDGISTINGVTTGQLLLGPLSTPTYEVTITDETNTDCTFVLNGDNGCIEPPVCDLALSSSTTCVGTESFEVAVTISGSGTYMVEEVGNTQTGLTAGTYTFGPYSNGEYEIVVTSETIESCSDSVTGSVIVH